MSDHDDSFDAMRYLFGTGPFSGMYKRESETPKPLIQRFAEERDKLELRLAIVKRAIEIMEKNPDATELMAILEKEK